MTHTIKLEGHEIVQILHSWIRTKYPDLVRNKDVGITIGPSPVTAVCEITEEKPRSSGRD